MDFDLNDENEEIIIIQVVPDEEVANEETFNEDQDEASASVNEETEVYLSYCNEDNALEQLDEDSTDGVDIKEVFDVTYRPEVDIKEEQENQGTDDHEYSNEDLLEDDEGEYDPNLPEQESALQALKKIRPEKKKKYECSYCSSTYTARHKLVIHERRHTGDKPYKCNLCDAGFTNSDALKTHVTKCPMQSSK